MRQSPAGSATRKHPPAWWMTRNQSRRALCARDPRCSVPCRAAIVSRACRPATSWFWS